MKRLKTRAVGYLPFLPRFHPLILSGEKTYTARTKSYGRPGAIVNSPVGPLLLKSVRRLPLEQVRDFYWKQEGTASAADFVAVWCSLHPKSGFLPQQRVLLHEFEPVNK